MAINDKNTKNPVIDALTAPLFPQVQNVTGGQRRVAAGSTQQPLKAATEVRLRSEQDVQSQRALAEMQNADKDTPNDITKLRLLEIIAASAEALHPEISTWISQHNQETGEDLDPDDPIDVAHAHFQRDNSADRQITSEYEATRFAPLVVNPRIPSQAGRDRTIPGSIIDDGFVAPSFKLDKNQARTELANNIRIVSERYASEAGMSARDFARVMGGIATIESSFGTLRSVKGSKFPSSAGGAFHYLNGTIADSVIKAVSDGTIAERVKSLGVSIYNGITKSEAWALKDDDILAGSILARRIVETVRNNPELKNNVVALTTHVYQAHNLGDGGARSLAQGRIPSVEAAENNPMFFRGTTTIAEVNDRYKRFVANAIVSSDPLIGRAFGADMPVFASAQDPRKQPAHSAPAPQPS